MEYHICTVLLSCTVKGKSSMHMALLLFFTYNRVGVVISLAWSDMIQIDDVRIKLLILPMTKSHNIDLQ